MYQATVATARRPARTLLTATGIALGVAVFLVTVGWSQTVGAQINITFDRLAATEIRISDNQSATAHDLAMPADFEERIAAINGVVAGGRIWEAGVRDVSRSPGKDPISLRLLSADPGFYDAAEVRLRAGRIPDASMKDQPVAVLGPDAARALGISRMNAGLAINLGTQYLLVAGILESTGSAPELNNAVIVPPGAPVGPGGTVPVPAEMGALVRIELGAAKPVSRALPIALRPDSPERLGLILPPEPTALRGSVQSSLDTLAYGAAGFSLFIGAIGIMNAMLTAVMNRSGEIGLRRSLGARTVHVYVQFLIEGALVGLFGAVLGAVVGQGALIGVAAINGWTPVLSRWMVGAAPFVGAVLGTVASAYPAIRAARITPATTLRR